MVALQRDAISEVGMTFLGSGFHEKVGFFTTPATGAGIAYGVLATAVERLEGGSGIS